MTKQNKKLYSSLINRIALVLFINQGLLLALSSIAATLEISLISSIGESVFLDIIFRTLECIVYFVSFIIPVNVFNKMNKHSEKEIYEPKECKNATSTQAFFMLGLGLCATFAATYLNYYLVDTFSNYGEFSQKYLWNAELDHAYQVIIYIIYCAIIPAIVEELLFRGTICRTLGVYGKKTAVVLSAVLFALMHSNIEQLLYAFVAGLALAWIYVETKKIIYPMILHFINNAVSVMDDVILAKCSAEIYEVYSVCVYILILVFVIISIVGFVYTWRREGTVFDKTQMKLDENGEDVLPLSISEKISGFFTTRMTLFTIYSILMMTYYIYLSTQLI